MPQALPTNKINTHKQNSYKGDLNYPISIKRTKENSDDRGSKEKWICGGKMARYILLEGGLH
jgi:hypothetical protein